MRVAVSITKVFEIEKEMNLEELKHQFERKDFEENGIDWFGLEEYLEIWSYAILD